MKSIPDFPGYWATAEGEIWLLRPMSLAVDKRTGHKHVCLKKKDGRRVCTSVHRLVLSAFVRPPLPGEEGRHKNGKPWDNKLNNLEWGTKDENMQDAVKHGTCPHIKLTEKEVLQIEYLCRLGAPRASIARAFSVAVSRVSAIAQHKTWKHLWDRPTA